MSENLRVIRRTDTGSEEILFDRLNPGDVFVFLSPEGEKVSEWLVARDFPYFNDDDEWVIEFSPEKQ